MTRLTQEQIDREWDATDNPYRVRTFAHRIAALAVQEVERERDRAITMSDQYRAKWADADSRNTALRAQLAEVTKERDALIRAGALGVKYIEAALATAKREDDEARHYIWQSGALWASMHNNVDLQVIRANNPFPFPATPSGELCDADCGCPSPEAREVPSDIVLPVEESMNGRWMWRNDFRAVITPADAKRIMDMAQRNT